MLKKFLLAFALTVPLIIFFIAYTFNHSEDLVPTGYIQPDNVSYIAYAKQYLDQDGFHLQYSNPFNEKDYQPIYFQPHTLFFALLLKLEVPPGWILPCFTIICTFICFLLLIAIYEHLTPHTKNKTLLLWLFGWGGGILVLAGIAYHYYLNNDTALADDFFAIDPEGGWWGLNFGRSLFFSCEAYYHALFLGTIYYSLKRKWIAVLLVNFLLSLSHPFTGIELSLIIFGWFCFEWIADKKTIPVWFGIGALAIVVFHIYYYLFYLERFADHKSVSDQYSLQWVLRYYRMMPAYCIVAIFTAISIYKSSVREFLKSAPNRLFLSWFVIAFLLANHEVFMTARQPIHFTRGYIWTSLFLLGLPSLQQFIIYLQRKRQVMLYLFVFIFLLDNFLWITTRTVSKATGPHTNYITHEQKEILRQLDLRATNQTLVITNILNIAYLSTVYTKAYPLYSHPYTTPFAEKKQWLQQQILKKGDLDSSLINRQIFFILENNDSTGFQSLDKIGAIKIFPSKNYTIFRYK
jgi:hypothetical protein